MGDGEPSLADVVQMLKTLSADVAGLKEKAAQSSAASSHQDGQHHTDRPPRFQKLDFPRFDGKSDPLLFINRCESYFRQQRTMPEERVWMASYNMEDIAQFWFIQLQEDEGTPPWGRFKELLQLRFGPPLRSAPLFELSECRRTGTVEEYSNRFQALLPRAGRLDEDQRVQLYTGGLLPPLSHQVRVHAPSSRVAAMSLARQMELVELDRLSQAAPRAAPRAILPAPAPRPAASAPAVLPAPAQQALPAPRVPLALPAPPAREGGQPTKRLTTEEQAERRRLGLCYNCNEPYSHGHNRVCRRIFYIDGVELAEDDESGEAPVFSLHAVAGVVISSTIQLRVRVGAADLTALVDTGSTHSFIGEAAAQRAGLPVETHPRMTATVANGERISCPGVLRQAPIVIDGMTFTVDLYLMPLAGYDVVLGTNWMAPLGDIVWNVAAGTMVFQHEGQTVCWRGTAPPSPPRLHAATPVTEPLLDELLDAF